MKPEPVEVPLTPACSVCIARSLGIMIPLLTSNRQKQFELLSLAFKRVSEGYARRTKPHPLSVGLYHELYASTAAEDPYEVLKRNSTDAASRAFAEVDRIVSGTSGYVRLRHALAASIVGNLIDFNTAAHEPKLECLADDFARILAEGFVPDHSQRLWDRLRSKTGQVLYLADNAGEVIFDVPLLRLFNEMGWRVVYVVKARPIINDATEADVAGTEIPSLAEVMSSGAWAHGVPKDLVSEEFMDAVKASEFAVSKGQANIETFPEIQDEFRTDCFYITRAKCPNIAKAIGVPTGANVVMLRSYSD
ncbi:MAG: DUF89 family protein [Candidatus Thorarchaeota archaeon]|nr:DUF89 family protein [Candidatus Thorarchaeota archaeon]